MIDSRDNKSFLRGMRGWSQFFFVWFLYFSGLMLGSSVMILSLDVEQLDSSARVMRMAQVILQVFMFLVPSLAFAYLCKEKPKVSLKTNKNANPMFLLLAVILTLTIQPVIDFLAYCNQQMTLPESMAFIEEKMRAGELAAEKAVSLLFADKSITGLIFNLLVIAIVAGLAEELFFRGCLQQILHKISGNEHVAIWVGAVIFSTMHFQFFGFIPRVLLGALLGYLFVWSRNLWVPIIVHTVNNAAGVIFAYIYYGTPEYEKMTAFSFEKNIWYIIPGIILSLALMSIIYRRRERMFE
jgi:membrane protease YdiL (CAAX protease family)